MPEMGLFLGVDAGGTKTRALLVGATGEVRGAGEAGPGNFQAIGAKAAGEAIAAAVRSALAAAGAEEPGRVMASAVRGSFFGLAGVRTEEERAVMRAEIAKLGLGGAVEIGSDLEAAHAGALAGGPGVVVIAGTGSAAWGRNKAGETWQAGGWGWLVDDKGGGYWLALQGLAAACEGEDGRGAPTGLGARAGAYFLGSGRWVEGGAERNGAMGEAERRDASPLTGGTPVPPGLREVLRELHAGKRDRAAVAGFAREVRAAADAGDAVAAGLVRAAGEELLRLAKAVRDRLTEDDQMEGWNFPLAVAGGLGMGPVIADEAWSIGFAPAKPWGEPVLGAVLRAARAGGAELDAAARARLLEGWKPTV